MLTEFSVRGFKSLGDLESLSLPRLTVLFGPNACGKSNFVEALQALARVGTSRTVSEALQDPIRGHAVENFTFPPGGLPDLMGQAETSFRLGAQLQVGKERFEYCVEVQIQPMTGSLTIKDEYLAALSSGGAVKGNPLIEKVGEELRIRRKSKSARPRTEPRGLNHSLVSDLRFSGQEYQGIERCRNELSRWRIHYLDPRVAMRRSCAPAEVEDIGLLGENIAPYLFRLQEQDPKNFQAIKRLLKTLIPSVEGLSVDLDKKRGTLDIAVQQNGISFSSRIISEGTLRILALCAIAVNPNMPALMAFEEPENGVHPRRLELVAEFLSNVALQRGSQLVVTTHSPLFCAAMMRKARQQPDEVGLFQVSHRGNQTHIAPFEVRGPLFEDAEIARALSDRGEDGVFEGWALRGMFDE